MYAVWRGLCQRAHILCWPITAMTMITPHNLQRYREVTYTVLQIIAQGSVTAQNLMLQSAKDEGADVLLASEKYRAPPNDGKWAVDSSEKVAVIATGRYPIPRLWGSAISGMVAADITGITYISCYAPPSLTSA